MNCLPRPLFDSLEQLDEVPTCVHEYLTQLIPGAVQEFQLCKQFLKSYSNSRDTFTAYRREVERLLHWSWLIQKKLLQSITRHEFREYLAFIQHPPKSWIITKIEKRFTTIGGVRQHNKNWRPFVVKVSKSARRLGKEPDHDDYKLSNKSLEALFAILSSLFTFLQQESYVENNPITLLRQKKSFLQTQQTRKITRKLSKTQWLYVISTAEEIANANEQHERTLFLLSTFYLLGLRVSELAYENNRYAVMGNFSPDKRGLWWYTTIGKGNKIRDVAVPDELLLALKRYRTHLNLTPLPARGEQTPLFPRLKGREGLGSRQIRNIVQDVFNRAIDKLKAVGKIDEADDLAAATVHWLRHTAISTDVEFRPREHIRDDVGHENPATMDKYIDTDRVARHKSAQAKTLKPIDASHETTPENV